VFCDGSAREIVAMLLAECAAAGVDNRLQQRIGEVSRTAVNHRADLWKAVVRQSPWAAWRRTACPVGSQRADAHKELPGQATLAGAEVTVDAAFVGLNRGVAKDGADQIAAMRPHGFSRRLIAAHRAGCDGTYRIGRAEDAFEPGNHAAKRRRIDAMALALELDPLQATCCLVHLEERNERHAPDREIAHNNLGIAVAEIERTWQKHRTRTETFDKSAARLAPGGSMKDFSKTHGGGGLAAEKGAE
jgi:hypothetical protein